MYQVVRRKDSYFETCRRNDFQPSRGAVIRGRAAARILLPGHIVPELLDQYGVSRHNRRNKVRLAGPSLVHPSKPRVYPTVIGGAGLA